MRQVITRVLTAMLLLCPVCAVAEGTHSREIEAALKRAGTNSVEIRKALKISSRYREGMEFLVANMPDRDLKTLRADFLQENTKCAYDVMRKVKWRAEVPKHIFLNYVLPYANVNERRDNWRKDFCTRFLPMVKDCRNTEQAGGRLNTKVFNILKVRYSKQRKKADQSPYETIESGMASCTGLSILLVDVCRSVGVPARFVGTPLWTDRSGNHSWVEIWDDGWHFTGAAEGTGEVLDRAWFGRRASAAQRDHPWHAIYAVSFKKTPLVFPLVWDRTAGYVRAVNVTDRYTQRKKELPEGMGVLMLRAVARDGGSRVAAAVKITDGETGKLLWKGVTKDERFDMNDHASAEVPMKRRLAVELSLLNVSVKDIVVLRHREDLKTYDISKGRATVSSTRAFSGGEEEFLASSDGKRLVRVLKKYFAADGEAQAKMKLDPALDRHLVERPAVVRKAAWAAYRSGRLRKEYAADFKAGRATYEKHVSPYVVRAVGTMPTNGWPLFIAMHGGGGAPKAVNDQQWQVMTRYYRDQPDLGGYLYLAPRAPNDSWCGFYTGYNLPLTDRLIRQMLLFVDVDPNKVYLMGASHGGYGAFFQGMRMADRFAAIHASAAAPTGYTPVGKNLRNTVFTFMIGEKDTKHGRFDKCKWFDEWIKHARGKRTDIYPVKMELIKGSGHVGIPDRNKIGDMYPVVRKPVPQEVSWAIDAVKDFNWLHSPQLRGGEVDAVRKDNEITLTAKKVPELHILLDERLIDYGKPVTIVANGKRTRHQVKPSLRLLCETMQARGDPEYMFAARIPVKFTYPVRAAARKK